MTMKTLIFLLLTIMMCIGCTREPTDSGDVKISIDYTLAPRLDYIATKGFSISEEYQAFYTKYIANRRLTPVHYMLNFTGINHHFRISSVTCTWGNNDLVTLPEDTYIVSGASNPDKYKASGDTCYLDIQDTIVINEKTTNITLKATYGCSLLLFDNSNIASYMMTAVSPTDDPKVMAEHNTKMMKTENFYHIFCRESNLYIVITTLDKVVANYELDAYTFDIGKYYYFEYINGSYNLQPMVNGNK
jgi:hypothetical protein